MSAEGLQLLADRERSRDELDAAELDALAMLSRDDIVGALAESRREFELERDAFLRQHWALRVSRLQRELAIRNRRESDALVGLSEQHRDALEKFVDRHADRHPATCEAIEAALALLGVGHG